MIRNCRTTIFIFILVSVLLAPVHAQTKIQVVTRTISRTFECKPGSIVNVKGEKAHILIKKSADNKIRVKISLISKNPAREIAETDLKYCDYQIIENDKGINISNFFDSKSQFKEISSNLSAKFEIEVPSGINLKLANIYGNIEMNGIEGILNLTVDFGKVNFSGISGSLYINSNVTDVVGNNLNAVANIKARKTDIKLSNIKNLLRIKNQYGSIELEEVYSSVNIDAEMTAIKIQVDDLKKYSFDLASISGNIEVPIEYHKFISNKSGDALFTETGGKILIKMKTTFSAITLK